MFFFYFFLLALPGHMCLGMKYSLFFFSLFGYWYLESFPWLCIILVGLCFPCKKLIYLSDICIFFWIYSSHSTGSGDVDTSTVVKADDNGCIHSTSGVYSWTWTWFFSSYGFILLIISHCWQSDNYQGILWLSTHHGKIHHKNGMLAVNWFMSFLQIHWQLDWRWTF